MKDISAHTVDESGVRAFVTGDPLNLMRKVGGKGGMAGWGVVVWRDREEMAAVPQATPRNGAAWWSQECGCS